MLSLDPSHRLGFTDHIENSAFPSFLPTVHQFFSALQSAMRFNPPTLAQTSGTSNTPLPTQTPVNLNDIPPPLEPVLHTASDLVIERLVAEWSSVVQFLGPDAPKADTFDESKSLSGAEAASPFPLRLAIPGYEIALPDLGSSPSPQTDGESLSSALLLSNS